MSSYIINHNCVLDVSRASVELNTAWMQMNGNSGNSMISHALARHVDIQCPTSGIANMFEPDTPIDDFDIGSGPREYAFLVMQDHLNPERINVDWERLTRLVNAVRSPIIVASLGVGGVRHRTPQAIVGGLSMAAIRFFKFLSEKSVSIGVRGQISAEVLDELGIRNIAVVGCPTFFERGPGRKIPKRELPQVPRVAGLGLFSSSDEAIDLSFVLQSERSFVELLHHCDHTVVRQLEFARDYPGYVRCVLEAFFREKMYFFHEPHLWRQTLQQNFDFAVGTRMHGAIAALNAGIPALVTAGDIRAEEMCALFKIPLLVASSTISRSVRQLYETIDMDTLNDHYDQLFANFVAWLKELGCFVARQHNPADDWPWARIERCSPVETRQRLVASLLPSFAP